ncbi:MAG TPA: glutathione-regulated potassium-efflux system protein KefC, partial [Polyangiaceae bacterium]
FKLGSVLGYLAAGAVIGPFGLRIANDPEATLHFAEIGVVLMLFVIGLELDPKRLWTLRRSVFGGGLLQLATCGLALGALLLALGLPWQGALVAGLALGLSSTAVSMQTMNERNLGGTVIGRSAFAVLLFQDIAAIPLVAIVPMLADAPLAGPHDSDSSPLGMVAALVLVFGVGRFVMPPLLRICARTHLREVFTAATLLLVLGIAWVMARAGLSMALGAFLAGVLLAGSEYRHALESDIEPFKGLLMGLFFMAVGMSIDFTLMAQKPLLILGTLGAFQIVKGIILAAIAPRLGVPAPQKWLLGALLAQGGEFAFVVFGVARSARLLPGDWDAVLTLTVALSMALSPLLMILHDRSLARRARAQEREDETIDPERAPVIIAGFGRFGQIVGRLLFASGIRATVLEHDPDQIEILRRFGFRIYYGDATRIDLLEAAGADEARVLVNTIDDPKTSLALVDAVRERFPSLTILARARNVSHYYELRLRGVAVIERETFESALLLGRKTLESLGVRPYEVRERADAFRRHNVATLEKLLVYYEDEAKRTQLARKAREELEQQFEQDRADLARLGGRDWHRDSQDEVRPERKPAGGELRQSEKSSSSPLAD